MRSARLWCYVVLLMACTANPVHPEDSAEEDLAFGLNPNAPVENLYFEAVRLHSAGLMSLEGMQQLQRRLDLVDTRYAEDSQYEQLRRDAILSALRDARAALSQRGGLALEGQEGRAYARRLNRAGVEAAEDYAEGTVFIAGMLGVPTSREEAVLVLAIPVGGYVVATLGRVALHRAALMLRRVQSADQVVELSEQLGAQVRFVTSEGTLRRAVGEEGLQALKSSHIPAFCGVRGRLASEIRGDRSIDPAKFARMKEAFQRQGGVIEQGPDAERYLQMRCVEAVTYSAKLFLLKSQPSTSAVFEEFIHTAQHRTGRYSALVERYGNVEAERLLEIEAAEKLIRNARAWDIPEEETRQTLKRLEKLRSQKGGQ